ncbi:MAG: hypothetical protein QXU98_11335 [Candidatus Parvarchaeota archaeon]
MEKSNEDVEQKIEDILYMIGLIQQMLDNLHERIEILEKKIQ